MEGTAEAPPPSPGPARPLPSLPGLHLPLEEVKAPCSQERSSQLPRRALPSGPALIMRPLLLLWGCLVLPGEKGARVAGCGAHLQARPLGLLEGPPESTFAVAVTQPRRLILPGFAPPYSSSSTLRGATCCLWNREPGLPPDLWVLDPSWLSGCECSFASFVFIS